MKYLRKCHAQLVPWWYGSNIGNVVIPKTVKIDNLRSSLQIVHYTSVENRDEYLQLALEGINRENMGLFEWACSYPKLSNFV